MDFSGRSVVLTGVGREGQVGEAVAAAFAGLGARVFLVDRQESEARFRALEEQWNKLNAEADKAFALVIRLRDELKFDSVETLIEQIGRDVEQTRELLGTV